MWPRNALTDLLGIELPIIQAPMASAATPELAAEVSNTGALGSLGFATSSLSSIEEQVEAFARRSNRGLNWNFFCHQEPEEIEARSAAMRRRLAPIFAERGLGEPVPSAPFRTFGREHLALIEAHRPRVVSFHFGLPAPDLLAAVKATGAVVMCSATCVTEARRLAEQGADVIIAQGAEAGGHRGTFSGLAVTQQAGTMALVPQIVDAVDRPVVAAGGIADGRGIAAALMLGASAVQMGTAFLHWQARTVDRQRAHGAAGRHGTAGSALSDPDQPDRSAPSGKGAVELAMVGASGSARTRDAGGGPRAEARKGGRESAPALSAQPSGEAIAGRLGHTLY
jgi:nitronate monooxygenase